MNKKKASPMTISHVKSRGEIILTREKEIELATRRIKAENPLPSSKHPHDYFHIDQLRFLLNERLDGASSQRAFSDLRERFKLTKEFTKNASGKGSYQVQTLLTEPNRHHQLLLLENKGFLTAPYIRFYCNSSSSTFINRVVKIALLVSQEDTLQVSTSELELQNTLLSNEVDQLRGTVKTASELKAMKLSTKEIAARLDISESAVYKRIARGS